MSQELYNSIMASFSKRRGNRPVYSEEIDVLDDWINRRVMDASLLEAILQGNLCIDVAQGEVCFFLSTEGQAEAEILVERPDMKELVARLDAIPAKEKKTTGALEDQILMMMYLWNPAREVPTAKILAKVLGVTESGAALALKSLADKGMIGKVE